MTEKTEGAATMAEEGLAATCEGIARDYLAHRGYEIRAADGWSCDCEDAPIVATDGDETVLIAVISACEEGSARMPELSVGAAEFSIMRRACLLYLADHGDVDAIRHDVVSIVVTGERQAKLRHLIGAWQWAESRE
jgi:putative endonuclease